MLLHSIGFFLQERAALQNFGSGYISSRTGLIVETQKRFAASSAELFHNYPRDLLSTFLESP
jgi:hypothetical protein